MSARAVGHKAQPFWTRNLAYLILLALLLPALLAAVSVVIGLIII